MIPDWYGIPRKALWTMPRASHKLSTMPRTTANMTTPIKVGVTYLAVRLHLIDMDFGVLSLKVLQCGYCHQRNYIVADALRGHGVKQVTLLGLNGHVVTTFIADGKRYATDADFGVGPFVYPRTAGRMKSEIFRNYSGVKDLYGKQLVDVIADAYETLADNQAYNLDQLDEIRQRQDEILSLEEPADIGLPVFGFLLVAAGFRLSAQSARFSQPSNSCHRHSRPELGLSP